MTWCEYKSLNHSALPVTNTQILKANLLSSLFCRCCLIFFSRIMVRSPYYLVFGLLSLSNHHGVVLSREEVVQFLSQQVGISSPMKLITVPSAPADILKMDNVSFHFLLFNKIMLVLNKIMIIIIIIIIITNT